MGGKTFRRKFAREGKSQKESLLGNNISKEHSNDQEGTITSKKKNVLHRFLNNPVKPTSHSSNKDNVVESPSKIALLDKRRSDDATPTKDIPTDLDEKTPPTEIMKTHDYEKDMYSASTSNQKPPLSPARQTFLSENRKPRKPYRRYDDSVDDDCCYLDDYGEFISLFKSTNIAPVKKKLFEGKSTIKTHHNLMENEVELQHVSYDVSFRKEDDDDELPFDETVYNPSTGEDEVYYPSNHKKHNQTQKPSQFFDTGNSVRKQLRAAFDSAHIGPINDRSTAQNSFEEIYDDTFTSIFIKNMVNIGKRLILHTKSKNDNNWIPVCVSMEIILPGTSSSDIFQPMLRIYPTHPSDLKTIHLYLHSIYSIKTLSNSQTPCFTITTKSGDIHVFELASVLERDNLTNGLKNVISRLIFHLVSGSMISYRNSQVRPISNDNILPIKSSNKTINDITMKMLK